MGNIPKLVTCTMVNVGQQTIVYQANNTVLNKVKPPFTTLSYRVSKNDVDATVYGGLKSPAAFKAHVLRTIDKAWLYPHKAPNATITRSQAWQGGQIEFQLGCIHVLNDKVVECKRRSGRNGAFIWEMQTDETTTVIPLGRKETLATAMEKSDCIGSLSQGVLHTPQGYAVRIPKDDKSEIKARALINPQLAEAIGDDLLNAPDSEGKYYEIKNLDSNATRLDVVIMFKETGWHVRPQRFLDNKQKYRNAMIVFARTAPFQRSHRYGLRDFIVISDYQMSKPKHNPWVAVFAELHC